MHWQDIDKGRGLGGQRHPWGRLKPHLACPLLTTEPHTLGCVLIYSFSVHASSQLLRDSGTNKGQGPSFQRSYLVVNTDINQLKKQKQL